MSDDLVVTDRVSIPESELDESFSRSGGPGGQHVNRTSSQVELRWNLAESEAVSERDRAWLMKRLASRLTNDGVLIIVSDAERSQKRNRDDARRRLAQIIREGLERPKARRKTKPTRGSIERRLQAKKEQGAKKKLRQNPPE